MGNRRIGIGRQLALGFGLVIALLLAVTVQGVLTLGELSELTNDALHEKYPNTQTVNEVIGGLGSIARSMRNTLLMTDPLQVREQVEAIRRDKQVVADAMSRLHDRVHDKTGRELLQQIDIIRSAYLVNQEEFLDLLAKDRRGEARNLLLVDLHPYQEDFFTSLNALLRHESALMERANAQALMRYQSARLVMVAMAVLAVMLGVGISALIAATLLRKLGGEPDYAAEIAHRIAEGDLVSEVRLRARDNSSLLAAMKTMRDKLVERNEALVEANTELERMVESLKVTQDELVQSEKLAALGALVAGVAHELNTPIGNSLLAASSLDDLTRDFHKSSEQGIKRAALESYFADVRHAADILVRNLNRSVDLVASFKQVAVDRASSQGRRFVLAGMVNEIVTTMWPTLKKLHIQFDIAIPNEIVMCSFPGPLGQVLTNLINNAVLHGFEGRPEGRIAIRASMHAHEQVELVVEDDGLGIPAESIGRIYDPFFTTKLGRGGSGLGLNIVYNIVHGVLGGRVDVESTVGQGTRFRMLLPTHVPGVEESLKGRQ